MYFFLYSRTDEEEEGIIQQTKGNRLVSYLKEASDEQILLKATFYLTNKRKQNMKKKERIWL